MKANSNFILRQIGDENILIPINQGSEQLHGIIRLSSSSAFLWKLLSSEQSIESLVNALMNEYDIKSEEAIHDVKEYINSLSQYGCICQ